MCDKQENEWPNQAINQFINNSGLLPYTSVIQDKPHTCQIPLLYPVEVSSDRQEFISQQEPQDPDFISFLPPAFHPSPFSHGLTYRLLSGWLNPTRADVEKCTLEGCLNAPTSSCEGQWMAQMLARDLQPAWWTVGVLQQILKGKVKV